MHCNQYFWLERHVANGKSPQPLGWNINLWSCHLASWKDANLMLLWYCIYLVNGWFSLIGSGTGAGWEQIFVFPSCLLLLMVCWSQSVRFGIDFPNILQFHVEFIPWSISKAYLQCNYQLFSCEPGFSGGFEAEFLLPFAIANAQSDKQKNGQNSNHNSNDGTQSQSWKRPVLWCVIISRTRFSYVTFYIKPSRRWVKP